MAFALPRVSTGSSREGRQRSRSATDFDVTFTPEHFPGRVAHDHVEAGSVTGRRENFRKFQLPVKKPLALGDRPSLVQKRLSEMPRQNGLRALT